MTKKKIKNPFKMILIFTVILLLFLGILLSPLFRIAQIDIFGNNLVTSQEILNEAQFSLGASMFTLGAGSAASRVVSLAYVKNVSISRHFPNRVSITISERVPAANIRLGTTTYILVDTQGVVLETGQAPFQGMPGVSGLTFTNFTVGQPLQVEQQSAFSDLLVLSLYFARYNFVPDSIDLSDPRAITFDFGGFLVEFGNMIEADGKIAYLAEIIVYLTEEFGLFTGVLDARDFAEDGRINFRLLQ